MKLSKLARHGGRILQAAALLCLVVAGAAAYARFAGYELLSVQSDSMRPMMQKDDAVLLNTHDTDPRPGDIVSFASPTNPKVVITHRAIGIDNKRGVITTKGDNTSQVDQPVPAWNVQGTVKRVIPRLGIVLNIIKYPLGLLLIIYLPALGVVTAEIRRLNLFYATGRREARAVHYRLHGRLS